MAITEKGISSYNSRDGIPNTLFTWLQKLQLLFPRVSTYSPTISLALIGATSYSIQAFTVAGLNVNDVITVNPPDLTSGLYLLSWRVSAADTLSMIFYNSTGAGITQGAAVYKIMATRL